VHRTTIAGVIQRGVQRSVKARRDYAEARARGRRSRRSAVNAAASIRPSATDRERSLTRVGDAGAARSSHQGNHATEPRPEARRNEEHLDHRLASRRGLSPRPAEMYLNCPRSARRLCRCVRVEAIGGQLSAERETRRRQRLSALASQRAPERGPAEHHDDRAEIRCRSRPVVFELSLLWPDDDAKGPLAGDQAVPAVPGTHQHDGRTVQLPAARGCALRRRLATQRRLCPRPRATVRATMRNVTTIAAVQRALGVARIGSGGTLSDQRRTAEFRIELRRARVLTLVSSRLTASASLLTVDGQAASHPSMAARASVSASRPPSRADSSRLQDTVSGRTRTDPPPGSGGEMGVNEVRETDRPTINERLRLRIARPADRGRRSAQPNIEMATDAAAGRAAAGSHGQGASVAAARTVAERAHEGKLDARRGVTR
jgi:hypothetical protein